MSITMKKNTITIYRIVAIYIWKSFKCSYFYMALMLEEIMMNFRMLTL